MLFCDGEIDFEVGGTISVPAFSIKELSFWWRRTAQCLPASRSDAEEARWDTGFVLFSSTSAHPFGASSSGVQKDSTVPNLFCLL